MNTCSGKSDQLRRRDAFWQRFHLQNAKRTADRHAWAQHWAPTGRPVPQNKKRNMGDRTLGDVRPVTGRLQGWHMTDGS